MLKMLCHFLYPGCNSVRTNLGVCPIEFSGVYLRGDMPRLALFLHHAFQGWHHICFILWVLLTSFIFFLKCSNHSISGEETTCQLFLHYHDITSFPLFSWECSKWKLVHSSLVMSHCLPTFPPSFFLPLTVKNLSEALKAREVSTSILLSTAT